MKRIFAVFLILFPVTLFAQEVKVYPTHWWPGMKNYSLQIMVHGEGIGSLKKADAVSISSASVVLKKVHLVENENYLFIDVTVLPTAKPGKFPITIKKKDGTEVINYELQARRKGNGTAFAQGVTSSDFIYLLMPDRFSNGDESNDIVAGMLDQTGNRAEMYDRHGGDLQGIINHLDYLQELGVTTVWPTPVIENNVPVRSEHGYGATNHYRIDPRFGGEQAYKNLSDALHKRKMKLIQDAVYNHVGSHHFTVLDLPMKDWLNQWPEFTQTHHKEQVLYDPHAAASDQKKMLDGWFVPLMPDLNQRNQFVANFLIQHAIWSVEEFGVDGFRVDTYKYNDLEFMNRCNTALKNEYPSITIFGESWNGDPLSVAYFTENNLNVAWKSNLPGSIDFPAWSSGILPALNEGIGWSSGVQKLYNTLSEDFVYKEPMNNVLILDNHDMTRFLSQVDEQVDKLKMGVAWLLTCRGIPQLYYGTEILMKGVSNPDGLVRSDFMGGWKEDISNKFTEKGRTAEENEMVEWVKKFGNFRKNSSAIKTGKMMQYVPDNGLYVYFRYDEKQTIMCVINSDDKERAIDFKRFSERTKNFGNATLINDGTPLKILEPVNMPAKSLWVMELKQ